MISNVNILETIIKGYLFFLKNWYPSKFKISIYRELFQGKMDFFTHYCKYPSLHIEITLTSASNVTHIKTEIESCKFHTSSGPIGSSWLVKTPPHKCNLSLAITMVTLTSAFQL